MRPSCCLAVDDFEHYLSEVPMLALDGTVRLGVVTGDLDMRDAVLGFQFIERRYVGGTIVGDKLSDSAVAAEKVLKYKVH